MALHIGLMGKYISTSVYADARLIDNCRLNVARLAKVPEAVLEVAAVKSKELEEQMQIKKLSNLFVYRLSYSSWNRAN